MPIYEYHCDACGHEFELIQSFSDKPQKKCLKCGKPVRKLISQSSFHLKGTGWYVTDYAHGGKRPGSAKTKPAKEADATKPAAPATTTDKTDKK